jgi:hypothetical protein
VSTTKSNSTRSIAAHPCKERKDGAPSEGIVQAKIVKVGHPPTKKDPPMPVIQPPPISKQLQDEIHKAEKMHDFISGTCRINSLVIRTKNFSLPQSTHSRPNTMPQFSTCSKPLAMTAVPLLLSGR